MPIITHMSKQTYIVLPHPDGYVVTERNAAVGISTHTNILDALAECRYANREVRHAEQAQYDATLAISN
jgi:hypothetical protein